MRTRMLKRAYRVCVAWLVAGGLAGTVVAENETPASNRAVDFEPYRFHLPQPAGFISATSNQNYQRVYYGNAVATLNPSPTIEQFKSEYGSNTIGLLFQESHGSESGFAVEAYPKTDAGLAQRDSRFSILDAQAAYHGHIYKRSSDAGHHISVFYSSAAQWLKGQKALVYNIICNGCGFDGWGSGGGVRVWYDCSTNCGSYEANANTFWARMDGQETIAKRRSGEARSDLSGISYGGNEETTLSPVVDTFEPGPRVPPEGLDVTWTFDTTVQGLTFPIRDLLQVLGTGIAVTSANWLTNTTLWAHVIPSGTVSNPVLRLRGDVVASANLTAAHLDGNTVPQVSPPLNGRGPGQDSYDVKMAVTIVERAAVGNFRVIDGTAEWEIAAEYLTSGYVVEGAQNVDGPWTQIGATLPPGLGPRSVDVSGSGYPLIRVVEEETSGFRREGPIETSVPPPPPPQELPSYATLVAKLESLEQTRLATGFQVQSLGPRCIVFTPMRFQNVVQTYVADYWQNWHGYQMEVVLTDQYPQPPAHEAFRSALQSAIRGYAAAGVEYFHLIGDWSDWRQFTDPAVYPALWRDAAWEQTRQHWVSEYNPQQDEHDVIPAFIFPDTIRSQNMDYVRPYDYSDLPYADINDDGIPDVVVTRWPLSDSVAVAAIAAKMQTYNDLPFYSGVAPRLLLASQDLTPQPKVTAAAIAADVVNEALVMRVDAYPDVSTFQSRVVSTWNDTQPELVISIATSSDGWNPCGFFRHFPEAATSAVTPPVIAGSCSANRWADPPVSGADRFERILTDPTSGAVVWLGPSSSSWPEGNGPLVRYTVQEVFEDLTRPLAEAWVAATQRVLSEFSSDPDIVKTVRTYAFIGDPLTKLRHYPIATDIAGGRQAPSLALGLAQNVPNPFNPTTQISFTTARRGHVTVTVYDVRGRLVRVLIDAELPPGRHHVEWKGEDENGKQAGTGVYSYRLVADGSSFTRKLVLVK